MIFMSIELATWTAEILLTFNIKKSNIYLRELETRLELATREVKLTCQVQQQETVQNIIIHEGSLTSDNVSSFIPDWTIKLYDC